MALCDDVEYKRKLLQVVESLQLGTASTRASLLERVASK